VLTRHKHLQFAFVFPTILARNLIAHKPHLTSKQKTNLVMAQDEFSSSSDPLAAKNVSLSLALFLRETLAKSAPHLWWQN
jgi:hypothetical protein